MAEVGAQLTQEASAGQQREQETHEGKQKSKAASKSNSPPSPVDQQPQSYQHRASGVSHSVLDAQLEALALGGQDSIASLLLSAKGKIGGENSLLELDTEDFLMFHPRKGPNSLLGTGSSIASSDHEVSSSDFESDSGIETSHPEIPSPEVGVVLSKPLQKGIGMGPYVDVMPHDDLAIATTTNTTSSSEMVSQSDSGEKSCEIRIDSFIQCLDEKASVGLILRLSWPPVNIPSCNSLSSKADSSRC